MTDLRLTSALNSFSASLGVRRPRYQVYFEEVLSPVLRCRASRNELTMKESLQVNITSYAFRLRKLSLYKEAMMIELLCERLLNGPTLVSSQARLSRLDSLVPLIYTLTLFAQNRNSPIKQSVPQAKLALSAMLHDQSDSRLKELERTQLRHVRKALYDNDYESHPSSFSFDPAVPQSRKTQGLSFFKLAEKTDGAFTTKNSSKSNSFFKLPNQLNFDLSLRQVLESQIISDSDIERNQSAASTHLSQFSHESRCRMWEQECSPVLRLETVCCKGSKVDLFGDAVQIWVLQMFQGIENQLFSLDYGKLRWVCNQERPWLAELSQLATKVLRLQNLSGGKGLQQFVQPLILSYMLSFQQEIILTSETKPSLIEVILMLQDFKPQIESLYNIFFQKDCLRDDPSIKRHLELVCSLADTTHESVEYKACRRLLESINSEVQRAFFQFRRVSPPQAFFIDSVIINQLKQLTTALQLQPQLQSLLKHSHKISFVDQCDQLSIYLGTWANQFRSKQQLLHQHLQKLLTKRLQEKNQLKRKRIRHYQTIKLQNRRRAVQRQKLAALLKELGRADYEQGTRLLLQKKAALQMEKQLIQEKEKDLLLQKQVEYQRALRDKQLSQIERLLQKSGQVVGRKQGSKIQLSEETNEQIKSGVTGGVTGGVTVGVGSGVTVGVTGGVTGGITVGSGVTVGVTGGVQGIIVEELYKEKQTQGETQGDMQQQITEPQPAASQGQQSPRIADISDKREQMQVEEASDIQLAEHQTTRFQKIDFSALDSAPMRSSAQVGFKVAVSYSYSIVLNFQKLLLSQALSLYAFHAHRLPQVFSMLFDWFLGRKGNLLVQLIEQGLDRSQRFRTSALQSCGLHQLCEKRDLGIRPEFKIRKDKEGSVNLLLQNLHSFLEVELVGLQPLLSLLITPAHLKDYIKIFSFLLKLHQCQRRIHNKWKKLNSSYTFFPRAEVDGLLSLRFQLNYFTNKYQLFLYQRIIQLAITQFERSLQPGTSLVQLKEKHSRLLSHILSAGYIQSQNQNISKMISKLFSSVSQFTLIIDQVCSGSDPEPSQWHRIKKMMHGLSIHIEGCIDLVDSLHRSSPGKQSH